MTTLKVKRLTPTAKLPVRATDGSAGYDVFACLDQTLSLDPGAQHMVGLGFSMAVPKGWGGFLMPRSGWGSKGLNLGNTIGVIDSDYTGEVKAVLKNTGPYHILEIAPDEAIAQLVFLPVGQFPVMEVDDLPVTARGAGGFGSTGKG